MNYYEIRKNDETRAEKVAAFIDQNVYCRAKDKIQRITDKELQLKGVDLM